MNVVYIHVPKYLPKSKYQAIHVEETLYYQEQVTVTETWDRT